MGGNATRRQWPQATRGDGPVASNRAEDRRRLCNANIAEIWWVNNDRLVFDAFMDGAEIKDNGAATFAVDHDGSNYRELIAWRDDHERTGTRIVSRVLTYSWFVHSAIDDGGNDILAYRRVRDAVGEHRELRPARLDTRTGVLKSSAATCPRAGPTGSSTIATSRA